MSDRVACPICRGLEHDVMFDSRSVSTPHSVAGLVVRCRCGMWFKIPSDPMRPSEAYGEAYAVNDGIDHYMAGETARAFFRNVLSELPVRKGPVPRLLDVGTGKGALLEQAQALGYDAEGIDVCEPLVQDARARGLRVARTHVEELSGRDRFDVVTMMDVIEHVSEPRRVLAAAHRLLTSGGQLVVYTPNHRGAVVLLARFLHGIGVDFAMREIFGGNHLSFFDDRSLPRALRSEGFVVRAVRLFPYDPARSGGPISRVSLSAVAVVERFGALFQRTFRMLAVATK